MFPMIFCAWDYRSGPIFRHRTQCDIKTPFDSVFEAAVRNQTNAVQQFNIFWLQFVWNTISLLLNHSHGFDAFRNGLLSLPINLPTLLAFDTSLQQAMPSILNLRKFCLLYRHASPRHQNQRS